MDNLKSKGLKAFAWDFFGKIVRHGTSFIVMIFLARLLEPSAFGLIAMVMVIVGVAFIFTDVGLGSALIQRRRLLQIHYSSVFYFNITIGTFLTLMTFFSATLISEFYENGELIPLIQVISFLFLINSFSSVQTNKLRRDLNYAALTKADVSAAVLSGTIGIILAISGAEVWSLVAQVMLRGLFYNIAIWMFSKWVPSLAFSFKALKQLWGFGFRIFLAGLLDIIFSNLAVIIIGKLFSPAVLGFFDQANRLNGMIVQYSSGSILAVMFPVMSKVQNDLPRFQHITIKSLNIISFVIFFLLGVMYLISDELIVLLFTEKWLPASEYFKIMLLSGYGYPVSALLVNILKSRGNSKAYLRLEIYKKIIAGINLYIGFLWGVEGYLYGLTIVTILVVSLNILFASREIRLPFFMFVKPVIIQMAISAITVLVVIFLTREVELHNIILMLIKAIVFVIIYFSLNQFLKISSFRDTIDQVNLLLNRKA